MSKENKFRVVDNRGSEPVIATVTSIDWSKEIICYVNEYNEEEVVPFKEAILLGYTGRHDGKHNDVYAGYILKSLSNNRVLEVFWSEAQCAFMVRSSGNANLLADWNLGNFEIIGDRHTTPELMEGK